MPPVCVWMIRNMGVEGIFDEKLHPVDFPSIAIDTEEDVHVKVKT
jgi:hypothetical protein